MTATTPADRMPVAIAARILTDHGRTLLELHAADPTALSFSDGTVITDQLGRFLGLQA